MANNPQYTGMQSHMIVHAGPPPNPPPHMSMQFRPGVPPPPPPPQSFTPVPPQQFQHTGHSSMGMPPHPPPLQYPQAGLPPPPPPPRPQRPPPDFQPLGQSQMSVSFMPSFGGPRILPPSYPLSSSSVGQQQSSVGPSANIPHFTAGGQPWFPNGNQTMQAIMPPQQAMEQNGAGQPWFSTVNQNINSITPLQQTLGPNDVAQQWVPIGSENVQSDMPSQETEEQSEKTKSDFIKNVSLEWKEHTTSAGKKYYFNKRTKVSSWEKPLEMMTPTEKADATTEWREYTIPDGRKFYYNKLTKISNWKIPNEVQLARANENMSLCEGTPTVKDVDSTTPNDETNNSLSIQQMVSSPDSLTPGSSSTREEVANLKEDATGVPSPLETTTPIDIITTSAMSTPKRTSDITLSEEAEPSSSNVTSIIEEINKSAGISESGASKAPEEKKVVYESKEEAKKAFKALLETANVGSGWNWDQVMRVIINDPRYAALRTLGERKQAFNEFVGKKKKQEAEERRARQKKAREDFKKMLEESKDLTSSTKWSKAVSMFENDERFHALERYKDREDLFADHIEEIIKKERAKALGEQKRYKAEYMEFLKSCDFIKASSQWRKVQHRLEADERCSRLDKIERLEIFQEYTRDLEKEEEELRKIKMDELRKAERKNRDEFRKLMEEHVANGTITSKTTWRDYSSKVKDAPAYLAVFSNTSGSTAKDLFEDVIEDLEKQVVEYVEDKERIEDAVKFGKISLATNWTIEDFKSALCKEISSKPISDFNLKRAFDELMEKTKEKDEKQTKRRKRQAEELYEFLINSKEITASSKWEDSKSLIEERFAGDKMFSQEIFDKVIIDLKEKGKEKERKRRDEKSKKERKDKEKKEKERKHKREVESRKSKDRRKRSETDSDGSGSYSVEESRRSRDRGKDRDRNRKHRRRRRDSHDDSSGDSKKSKEKPPEVDAEGKSKRHKRDHHRDDREKHKDEELGEDGELR